MGNLGRHRRQSRRKKKGTKRARSLQYRRELNGAKSSTEPEETG